jgi:hypothetical protein
MQKIKAFFRNVPDSTRAQFKNFQCLLTISVGQATHEGEMFAVTMELINASFGSCVLLIDDTLQRHTMALNKPEEADFYNNIALQEGELWLERNKQYYSSLTIPTKIMRWDFWLNHPEFNTKRKEIIELTKSDPAYKATFVHSIEAFLNKYCERLVDPIYFDIQKARRLSFDFVVEECTALSLWPELMCHYEVYPNRHNKAIEESRKRFVLPHYADLLCPITIGFKNARQIQPQKFNLIQTSEGATENVNDRISEKYY